MLIDFNDGTFMQLNAYIFGLGKILGDEVLDFEKLELLATTMHA
jgi:hypothetical protein